MDCAGALEHSVALDVYVWRHLWPWKAGLAEPSHEGTGPGGDVAALNMPANLENSAVATGLENVSFHSKPKKGNAKECSNHHTIALISHAGKVMIKILQVRLRQYVYWKLPDVQAGFKKGRETRDQIANLHWIKEKATEFQKNIYFCFIDYAKTFV